MDDGTMVEVWYQDDSATRHKLLTFLKSYDGLVEFKNERSGRREIIPSARIVRMETSIESTKKLNA